MVLYAKQYGVAPGKDVSKEINEMFASLSVQTEPVIVILEPGIYHLTADHCPKVTMYISNASVGDSSMYGNQEGDDLHVVPVGWYWKICKMLQSKERARISSHMEK